MHTLVDFLTRVKGVEYILSVLTIAGFILFLEVLKPAPFKSLRKLIAEDVAFLREEGFRSVMKTVGRFVEVPFIGLLYVISLPFLFVYFLAVELRGMAAERMATALDAVGASAVFGWRPSEAYLAGRKARKARKAEKKDEKPEPTDGDT
jgi:uncharacterized membrane protein